MTVTRLSPTERFDRTQLCDAVLVLPFMREGRHREIAHMATAASVSPLRCARMARCPLQLRARHASPGGSRLSQLPTSCEPSESGDTGEW